MRKCSNNGSVSFLTFSSVAVDYNGFLEYKEEPYDSSYLRKQGQRFKLGEGKCFKKSNYLLNYTVTFLFVIICHWNASGMCKIIYILSNLDLPE